MDMWLHKFEYACVWNASDCFLRNSKMSESILLPSAIFPLNLYMSLCCMWVRQSLCVSQENVESCKSDISLPGGGPRRIFGRFHLSHIAPWSTWLLLASPISLPFVPICAQCSVCLYIQRAGLRMCDSSTSLKTTCSHSHKATTLTQRERKDVSVITQREYKLIPKSTT